MLRWARRRMGRPDKVGKSRDASGPDRGFDDVLEEPSQEAADEYFESMSEMQIAISEHDYETAACWARKNLAVIPAWIKEEQARAVWTAEQRKRWGMEVETDSPAGDDPLLPPSIPVFQQGGTILALVGDEESLSAMADLAERTPELKHWANKISEHLYNAGLFVAISDAVRSQPNCLQPDVKRLVGEKDGRRVANLISYLEKGGKIMRVRQGRTYRLFPAESQDLSAQTPQRRPVVSHRVDNSPREPRLIDLSSLDYVPLPPSPTQWDAAVEERDTPTLSDTKDHFKVLDAAWIVQSVESLPFPQRPDLAFRRMYPNGTGLLAIDDLGNAQGMEGFEASVLRYDRTGKQVTKAGLYHSLYRIGVHPLGQALIAMSKDCIVHAYDEQLQPLLETALDQHPEIIALRKRFDSPTTSSRTTSDVWLYRRKPNATLSAQWTRPGV